MITKTATDLHWNARASSVASDVEVNIMDVFQREFEYDYVCKYLTPDMRVLEVGCGNGFSTRRFRPLVQHVDAFDFAENMIERARATVGEKNNRFFHDNVLAPKHIRGPYDAVICVRVLINLANLDQQKQALANMKRCLKPRGILILVEGFTEGFTEITRLRNEVGLPPVTPASINFYSSIDDLASELHDGLTQVDTFHLGSYDFLTRVLYPLIVGADQVAHNSNFCEKCVKLARAFNPDAFAACSRIRGFVLRAA
jgi:ubiquinone/menaquinone biosynthesis C-methylase UbiE